jgi:hypothetical protein
MQQRENMTALAAPRNRVGRVMERMTFRRKMWSSSGTRRDQKSSSEGRYRVEKSARNRDREREIETNYTVLEGNVACIAHWVSCVNVAAGFVVNTTRELKPGESHSGQSDTAPSDVRQPFVLKHEGKPLMHCHPYHTGNNLSQQCSDAPP